MGLGIMVSETGVLEMFGHLYQPTWTRLTATAQAGASVLELAESVDWQPGQQLVIATSHRVDYPVTDENEVRTIASVDGARVTLTEPLAYKHYGGPEYQVEVGLLSRNLMFRTSQHLDAVAPLFGGHIMVHSKNARVSGVELHGLGQQNRLARYPFHFHRAGDVAGAAYFTDSSIWRSKFRCAVIHRTDRALVSRNVAYDNWGHCYYFEDGVEMNNEMSFNLAVRTKFLGPTDAAALREMRYRQGQLGFVEVERADLIQPADRAAAGFYITNGNNRIIGNASSRMRRRLIRRLRRVFTTEPTPGDRRQRRTHLPQQLRRQSFRRQHRAQRRLIVEQRRLHLRGWHAHEGSNRLEVRQRSRPEQPA